MPIATVMRKIYRLLRSAIFHDVIPCSNKKINAKINHDSVIEVIGFFESYSGIGESARLCANALKDAGFKVKCTSVEKVFKKKSEFSWSKAGFYQDIKPLVRIFHLNPPMLPPVIFSLGFKRFIETYNIGYWAWELEDIPREWKKAIRYMNAIFTPSTFTSNAIQRNTNKSVYTVMHPVKVESAKINPLIRANLNIPKDAFVVSSIFSFGSALERKNPQALIQTFNLAFQHNENAFLILKSNAGSEEEKREIQSLIAGNQKILLIDALWSKEDILGLIKTSNLYASLHRSEGFGLTIAEAMLLDVPVMVTNWSGSADFCNKTYCSLIDCSLIPVESSHPEFSGLSSLTWADANVVQASNVLSDMYELSRQGDVPKNIETSDYLRKLLNQHSYMNALAKLN